MQARIQRVQLPSGRRVLMVSDIHGHATGLQRLLEKAKFCSDDILVIVGDLVEKGPESLKTVRLVMQLCQTHTVYPLMGNVDLLRMQRLLSDDITVQQALVRYSIKAHTWWGVSFLEELCGEIGVEMTADMDTQRVFPMLRAHFAAEFAFLMGLPTVLETQRMIFVHGGVPHERLDELTDAYPLMKWDRFDEEALTFDKFVVVGHWPVTLYPGHGRCSNPIIDREKHIICLDGGCGIQLDGQLNLLMLTDWQAENFELLTWNEYPTVTALDMQNEREETVCFRYGRQAQRVTVLEERADGVRAAYQGREYEIPAAFISYEDGDCVCFDYTDYQLPVQAGDMLTLVLHTARGCYVKKDGVTGWYAGRYLENE